MFQIQTSRPNKVFQATCLGYIDEFSRDYIDRSPKKDAVRPVLFKFACSSAIYRPFTANIALGEPICRVDGYRRDETFELMRKVPYKLYAQELGDITVGTYLLEEPFEIEPRNPFHEEAAKPSERPKVAEEPLATQEPPAETEEEAADVPPEPRSVRFCLLPSQADLEANTAALDVKMIMSHVLHVSTSLDPKHKLLKYLPAYALLWAGYVDRRINAPIIQEPDFITQAFVSAIHHGLVSTFEPYGMGALGYARPWYCNTHEATLREVLSREIAIYQQVKGYGERTAPKGL